MRRTLLTDDIFDIPDRRLHEDITTFVRVMFKVRKYSHVAKPIYFYTLNENSITNTFDHSHADGITLAFYDWAAQALKSGYREALAPSIAQGVEVLLKTCVRRTSYNDVLSIEEKSEILRLLNRRYRTLPIDFRSNPTESEEIALLSEFGPGNTSGDAFEKHNILKPKMNTWLLDYGMQPSDMASRLKDKIVFICQVDYQLRNAAAYAKCLRLEGHPCVVLDNSNFVAGGKRKLASTESNIFWRTPLIRIPKPPYGVDWLSTAKLVFVFNDFNEDFTEALEYRHRLRLPTACIIEGINDFLRVGFDECRYLPYRRCDNVILTGPNDEKYFSDRSTYLAGLPIVETLSKKIPTFPSRPLAVLNVNFTYGSYESARECFIEKARDAFDAADIDWVITQHPMDNGALEGYPVSSKTQYELIDEGTVFVSRFATGIIEALASGKPVIYFNPHEEIVDKFFEPMGAFEIATNEVELTSAIEHLLREVAAGVNFREQALPFLEHHTCYRPDGSSVSARFSKATAELLASSDKQQTVAAKLFLSRLYSKNPFGGDGGDVLGDFGRTHHAQMNEEELIGRYFGERGALMIDVGANFGNSLDIFLGKGWTVHAFEPDPNNRKKLVEAWPSCSRLIVNADAVSNKAGSTVPFYASDESTGISSLAPFTRGHKKICEVKTTTLRDYCQTNDLRHIDFLKIDVEGFDKFVLDGFPWEVDKPDVVLAEFEDRKTNPLGYATQSLAQVLIRQGYTVYVSEWHPILRYGVAHDWRRLRRYSEELNLQDTWGNLIGFLTPPDEGILQELAQRAVKFSPVAVPPPAPANLPSTTAKISAGNNIPVVSAVDHDLFTKPPPHWNTAGTPHPQTATVRGGPARLAGEWTIAVSTLRTRLRKNYRRFAAHVRITSPVAFAVGQVISWLIRTAYKHAAAFGILLIGALILWFLPHMFDVFVPYHWHFEGLAAGLTTTVFLMTGLLAFRDALRQWFFVRDLALEKTFRQYEAKSELKIAALEQQVESIAFNLTRYQSMEAGTQKRSDVSPTSVQSAVGAADQRDAGV